MIRFNVKNISILSLLFFILLFLRRGMQLLHPDIWNEDGYFNMGSFILSGWHNLYEPTQGYLVLIPKLITDISMSISFIYYPEVSTYLTWLFTIILALTVVYAPTMLKYPVLAALFIFLIPTNAEAFGLPLFTLWFSAILLFLAALWKPGEKQIMKNTLLVLAGFSSPTIVIIIPIQIFRMIMLPNKKEELLTLLLSIGISAIQLSFIFSRTVVGDPIQPDFLLLQNIIHKFFAFYYLGAFEVGTVVLWIGGLYLIVLMVTYFLQNRKDIYFQILVYLFFATIALSVSRFNPIQINPIFGGGARYFFLPYILLSWVLIYMLVKNKWYEIAILPILTLSIITALQGFCLTQDSLNWRKHITLCQNAKGKYSIPIQNDGRAMDSWYFTLDAKICKQYIENDIFDLPEMREK